ncbi:MAG: sulfite exporter TauE/SafE family protein [Ruminococcus sp.]|nr:sulfite exporter TauE/SafE family protein [Ruminococcus sp.]
MGIFYYCLIGILTGLANGLFGSGGGIVAVPMLKKSGLDIKEAHATSLALTLPLSIVSCIFYQDVVRDIFSDTLVLILFGLGGAWVGGILMKKLKPEYLKKAFGLLLVISGVRLFFK